MSHSGAQGSIGSHSAMGLRNQKVTLSQHEAFATSHVCALREISSNSIEFIMYFLLDIPL